MERAYLNRDFTASDVTSVCFTWPCKLPPTTDECAQSWINWWRTYTGFQTLVNEEWVYVGIARALRSVLHVSQWASREKNSNCMRSEAGSKLVSLLYLHRFSNTRQRGENACRHRTDSCMSANELLPRRIDQIQVAIQVRRLMAYSRVIDMWYPLWDISWYRFCKKFPWCNHA